MEYDRFLFGWPIFRCELLVLGSVFFESFFLVAVHYTFHFPPFLPHSSLEKASILILVLVHELLQFHSIFQLPDSLPKLSFGTHQLIQDHHFQKIPWNSVSLYLWSNRGFDHTVISYGKVASRAWDLRAISRRSRGPRRVEKMVISCDFRGDSTSFGMNHMNWDMWVPLKNSRQTAETEEIPKNCIFWFEDLNGGWDESAKDVSLLKVWPGKTCKKVEYVSRSGRQFKNPRQKGSSRWLFYTNAYRGFVDQEDMQQTNNIHSFHRVSHRWYFRPSPSCWFLASDSLRIVQPTTATQLRNNKSSVQLLQEGCIVWWCKGWHRAWWLSVGVDDLLDDSFEGSCHVLSNVFFAYRHVCIIIWYMIHEYNFNQNSQNQFVVSIL